MKGSWNPDTADGAYWLDAFMRRHGLTKQDVNLVLGVNPARVQEWLKQEKRLPANVQRRLERWEADGCPRFAYWRDAA